MKIVVNMEDVVSTKTGYFIPLEPVTTEMFDGEISVEYEPIDWPKRFSFIPKICSRYVKVRECGTEIARGTIYFNTRTGRVNTDKVVPVGTLHSFKKMREVMRKSRDVVRKAVATWGKLSYRENDSYEIKETKIRNKLPKREDLRGKKTFIQKAVNKDIHPQPRVKKAARDYEVLKVKEKRPVNYTLESWPVRGCVCKNQYGTVYVRRGTVAHRHFE